MTVGWMQRHPPHSLTELCHREERRVSPHFFRMLSCRLHQPKTDGACWWHATQAKSTDRGLLAPQHRTTSLIGLTCLLTTLTELSAAPLDCGSPSADVSCTTSPVQANVTALGDARMEAGCGTEARLCAKLSHRYHLLTAWESKPFRENQISENRFGHSIVRHKKLDCLHVFEARPR